MDVLSSVIVLSKNPAEVLLTEKQHTAKHTSGQDYISTALDHESVTRTPLQGKLLVRYKETVYLFRIPCTDSVKKHKAQIFREHVLTSIPRTHKIVQC